MDLVRQLERDRADVVAWAERMLVVRNPSTGRLGHIRFGRHQKDWLYEGTRRDKRGRLVYRTLVASWPKREGKSLCASVLLAHRMCCFAGQLCVVLANSERQAASVIFDELVGFFRNSPDLQAYTREDDIQTRRLAIPTLGNEVVCVPCNYRTVQGIAVTGILACDELHAAQDIRAYNYLAAQTEAMDAQVVISSQAGEPIESNPVWRLYEIRDQAHVHFSYLQDHVSPWAVELGKRHKAELLPGEWAILHRNAWAGLGMKLCEAEDIEAAAMDYREPTSRVEFDELRETLGFRGVPYAVGVGLDRAGVSAQGDRSVWSVVVRFDPPDEEPQFRVMACWVMRTGSEAEVLACAKRTREIFGRPAGMIFEYYNCGDVVDKVRGAELGTPSTPRQQVLFNRLGRIARERRFGFPAKAGIDPKKRQPGLLKAELIGFEYDSSHKGLPRFGVQSGHDDTVYSLAWAVEAVGEFVRRTARVRQQPKGMRREVRERRERRRGGDGGRRIVGSFGIGGDRRLR